MPLRSVKMKRFIFGFQRRVWCPKWTPLSSSCFMVTTWLVATVGLPFSRRGPRERAAWRLSVCLAGARSGVRLLTPGSTLAAVAVAGRADR